MNPTKALTKILLVALLLLSTIAGVEENLDIATTLMRSTFKIEAENVSGTAFIMGEPSPDKPGRAYYVLITAAHVLEEMKSDLVVFHLRKQVDN